MHNNNNSNCNNEWKTWGKLNLNRIEAPPHRLKTDKGKMNQIKIPLLFRHLAVCQRWSWGTFESRRLRDSSTKMVPSCPLTVGRTYVRQLVSGNWHQGSETAVQLHFTSEYAVRSSLAPSQHTTIAHDETFPEAPWWGHETHSATLLIAQPNHQRPMSCSACEPIHTAQTRESCSFRRTVNKSQILHVLWLMFTLNLVHPLVTTLPPSDLICSSHTLFFFINLTSRPSNLHLRLRGVACSHKTREGGASAPSAGFACLLSWFWW